MTWARDNGGEVVVCDDIESAVADSDCVVADTWVSMSTERGNINEQVLEPYRVDDRIMALAKPDAIFMHWPAGLPWQRGDRIGHRRPQSVVWDEAENRLHAQKGILMWCLGDAIA